jgi:Co/Zn/Cd efflux system component
MSRTEIKIVFLSTSADFWIGMATAWAFAAIDSLNHLAWLDLLFSLLLAILAFSLSVGIRLKVAYAKHS